MCMQMFRLALILIIIIIGHIVLFVIAYPFLLFSYYNSWH